MTKDKTQLLPESERKRKVKALPLELEVLTDEHCELFELALEIDPNPKSKTFGKEFLTAQGVRTEPSVVIDLKGLSIDNLRKICQNVGIVNCGSLNKFNCRKAIATYFRYQDQLAQNGLKPSTHAARVTSTICRAVNVVFSSEFIEDFKAVNDRKTRQDHETKSTYKAFWIRASLAHNSCNECDNIQKIRTVPSSDSDFVGTPAKEIDKEIDDALDDDSKSPDSPIDDDVSFSASSTDNFTTLVFPPEDIYLVELALDKDVNLLCVDQFDTEAFRMKILDLFKIRRKIKENVTVSGTHDSEPWNFVECAMKGHSGVTKLGAYYFYQRCEENIDIDGVFQPFLDNSLKGDTVSLLDDEDTCNVTSSTSKSSKRAKLEEAELASDEMMKNIMNQADSLMQHLVVAAEDRKAAAEERKAMAEERKVSANDRKKKMKFHARLEVAKALNDTNELRKLMEEANAMEDNED